MRQFKFLRQITIHFGLLLLLSTAIFAQSAMVKAENANLRGTPGMTGKVVDTVSKSTSLEIIKQKGAWYLVQAPEFVGWIHVDTISISTDKSATSSNSEIQNLSVPTMIDEKPTVNAPIEPKTTNELKSYLRGKRGGCYYLNSNGTKVYVNRSFCD
jgi:uncharacterized protein YgiM (DUF1202 family)